MATIQAGGSRRSANPLYTPYTPTKSTADNSIPTQSVDELMRRQLVAALPAERQPTDMSEVFGMGTATSSGSGTDRTFGGAADPALGGMIGNIGRVSSALGTIAGNADASMAGGVLGLAGNLSKSKTDQQALGSFVGPALSLAGAPTGAIGIASGLLNGNTSLAINSTLSLANPVLGALNGIASLFGVPTLGEVLAQTFSSPDTSTPDSTVGGSGMTGFGQVGSDLGNLRYSRDDGGSGGGFGGYGGGIGQSGGNAAGVGSHQA